MEPKDYGIIFLFCILVGVLSYFLIISPAIEERQQHLENLKDDCKTNITDAYNVGYSMGAQEAILKIIEKVNEKGYVDLVQKNQNKTINMILVPYQD